MPRGWRELWLAGTVALVSLAWDDASGLAERLGEAGLQVLEQVGATARDRAAEHGGYWGDAVAGWQQVVFADPLQALTWAMVLQQELLERSWSPEVLADPACGAQRDPDGTLLFRGPRPRIGLVVADTAPTPDPDTGRPTYVGPAAERALALGQAAHGGLVLLDRAAVEALGSEGIEAAGGVGADQGKHRLQGQGRPLQLVGVVPPPENHELQW